MKKVHETMWRKKMAAIKAKSLKTSGMNGMGQGVWPMKIQKKASKTC